MMKLKVGVQLFSVMGELTEDYLKTMENVAKAGYKYVEYVSPRPNADGKVCSPEEIGNKLVELGLTAIGSHVYLTPIPRPMRIWSKSLKTTLKCTQKLLFWQ